MTNRWPDWKFFVALFWGIQVVGLFLNYYISYPWEGTVFSLGGLELISAKLWFGHGVKRLAGFGRSSAITGNQLLILSVLLLGTINKQKRYSFLIWGLSIIAIVFTTNKSAILTIIFIGLLWAFWIISPHFGRFLLKISILGIGLFLILLPIIAFFNSKPQFTQTQSILNSFNARFNLTWPGVFVLISEQLGNPFLGVGVGGIGTAQKFYNPGFQEVTDNLGLYLYASFGLIGLILIFLCILSSLSSGFRNQQSFTMGILALVIFSMGITSNVIEFSIKFLYFWRVAIEDVPHQK